MTLLSWLIPFRTIIVNTSLSPAEVAATLRRSTHEKKGLLDLSYGGHAYVGNVSETGFKIRRVISYRNSFLPVIGGSIMPRAYGSSVQVSMRMNWFTIMFMLIWMGGVLVGAMVGTVMFITEGKVAGLGAWGMVAIGLAMFAFGFGREANIAEQFLRAQLPAPELLGLLGTYRSSAL